jgi:hypothetical protein
LRGRHAVPGGPGQRTSYPRNDEQSNEETHADFSRCDSRLMDPPEFAADGPTALHELGRVRRVCVLNLQLLWRRGTGSRAGAPNCAGDLVQIFGSQL